MSETDPAITATLMAVALGLVKILEALVSFGFKKLMGKLEGQTSSQPALVQLTPEVSQMIRDVHVVATRANSDGLMLVYGPRSEIHELQSAISQNGSKLEDIDTKADNILSIVRKQ